MFVGVVSLSQMLYDKCLCVLSRYLRCCMINVCVCCLVISDVYDKCLCVLSRYLRCCMINVCVCCLVISDVV